MDQLKEEDMKGAQTLIELKSDKRESPRDNSVEDVLWKESHTEHVEQEQERGIWANKLEFFLAIVGYTVGVACFWRFPIICSRNGGGAFLIPFFFFLITAGGPLYYLEVCLGQFTGESAVLAFEYCSLFKGIGVLQVVLSFVVIWYAMIILAWVLYFLYSSFHSVLPWTTCNNTWNTKHCTAISDIWTTSYTTVIANTSYINYNSSMQVQQSNSTEGFKQISSADEFWNNNVIGRSRGLEDMGGLQYHLVICLFIAWVLSVAAIFKGVKTLGKVVYVTAITPYVFLTIMLIKGLTLDGAMDGIKAYVTPDLSKLFTAQVWLEAAVQVFYSLGPSWGGVITMSSYNKFHQKSFWSHSYHKSSTMCVVCAGFSSFYNGLVVFTILGFMAKVGGKTVIEVAQQTGSGLAFVAFPTALSLMPIPQLWSALFFVMLILVVFDSLFGLFETVTSGIIDMFPRQLVKRRVLVNILTGLGFFVTGLPLTMNGGIYLFQLFDWYVSSFALLLGSILECISICWIYGTDRFARDIHIMTGRDVSVILRIMWTILVPLFVGITFIILLAGYSTPAYGDGYVYSTGAVATGICLGMLPIIAMIVVGATSVIRLRGSFMERLKGSLKPSKHWAPNDKEALEEYRFKHYSYPKTWWKRFLLNIRGSKDNPIF